MSKVSAFPLVLAASASDYVYIVSTPVTSASSKKITIGNLIKAGLPAMGGHAGKQLTTDGVTYSWEAVQTTTPAGGNGTIQINQDGAFAALPGVGYNQLNSCLWIGADRNTLNPLSVYIPSNINAAAGRFERAVTTTTVATTAIGIVGSTSGNMLDGFGAGFNIQLQDDTIGPVGGSGFYAQRAGGDQIIDTVIRCANGVGVVDKLRINSLGVLGLTCGKGVASASTIIPTGAVFHVTGTSQINTITPPLNLVPIRVNSTLYADPGYQLLWPGTYVLCSISVAGTTAATPPDISGLAVGASFSDGTATLIKQGEFVVNSWQITIIPDGAFTLGTSGNIAIASIAVVGRALHLTYDQITAKWYPSY